MLKHTDRVEEHSLFRTLVFPKLHERHDTVCVFFLVALKSESLEAEPNPDSLS